MLVACWLPGRTERRRWAEGPGEAERRLHPRRRPGLFRPRLLRRRNRDPEPRLAAPNGLRFTQFYNTARCWPSRGALLTGYYAQQIHRDTLLDVPGGTRGVRQPWARLLPDFLKPAGYRCYHSGKWHVDGKVLDGGFDRSLNMNNQGNYFSAAGNAIDDNPSLRRPTRAATTPPSLSRTTPSSA